MDYAFSEKHASRAVRFIETQIRYVEGAKAGQPFILEEWQRKIVRDLFGWLRPDGTRRYRTAYVEVPRKNGKSSLGAALALYLLLCDGENRPQVYSAAGDRNQARVVFDAARDMVDASAPLKAHAELRQYRINGRNNGGWYEACSAEAYSGHGKNPHGIIFDELHVQKTRAFYDSLCSGRGARAQPLVVILTTAGYDRSSICWEVHQRAERAIADPDSDPTFYGVIYGAAADEDWTDEAVWAKANPNLGVSVSLEFLREECAAAKENPAAENTFRNLYLNQWTQQAVRWIPMHVWDKCRRDFTEDDLIGRTCYAGLDMASTRDANAMVLLFPEKDGAYYILPYFWIPGESKSDRAHQDRRQMLNFASQNHIRVTGGNVTDFYLMADEVRELREKFDIRMCAFDHHGPAQAFVQICTRECGFDVDWFKEYSQSKMSFAAPTKIFERLFSSEKLWHNGHPVLRWMAENVAVKPDANDNIRPDKEASADKIDGIVAAIMALGVAIEELEAEYVYQPGTLAV